MQQLPTTLVELTYLDLCNSRVGLKLPGMIHLRSLPDLKELHVDETFKGADLLQLEALPIASVGVDVGGTREADLSAWLRNAAGHLQHLSFHG